LFFFPGPGWFKIRGNLGKNGNPSKIKGELKRGERKKNPKGLLWPRGTPGPPGRHSDGCRGQLPAKKGKKGYPFARPAAGNLVTKLSKEREKCSPGPPGPKRKENPRVNSLKTTQGPTKAVIPEPSKNKPKGNSLGKGPFKAKPSGRFAPRNKSKKGTDISPNYKNRPPSPCPSRHLLNLFGYRTVSYDPFFSDTISWRERIFDGVVSLEVFEHMQNPVVALRYHHTEVLKRGGYLVIGTALHFRKMNFL